MDDPAREPTGDAAASVVMLDVPPMRCVVPHGVFDAWSWCASDVLEWRRPTGARLARGGAIDGQNPPGLVFVMRDVCPFLPSELARLHAFGYGLEGERALAPYAIDDATDLLYEHDERPRDVFWLAAGALDALFWGLHDWAHFHNHGPFDQPALTELQCDLIALAWLRRNAERIDLEDPTALDALAREVARLSRRRFDEEGAACPEMDLDALFLGPYPASLAPPTGRSAPSGPPRRA